MAKKRKNNKGKVAKIIAGTVAGVLLIGGAGVGIACSVNPEFKNKVENVFKFESKKDLRTQIEILQEQLEEYTNTENTINTLKADKEKLQLQITENATEINNLKAEKAQLEEQLKTAITEEAANNLKEKIKDLENRVSVLEAKEVELTNRVTLLNNQIAELNNEVDDLWQLIVDNEIVNENLTENRIAKLQQELNEKQELRQSKEDEREQIKIELAELKTELENSGEDEDLSDLERRIAELERRFQVLETEINQLNSDINELQNKINTLRNLISSNKDSEIQTFSILGQTFNFEVGMTWKDWFTTEYSSVYGEDGMTWITSSTGEIYYGNDEVMYRLFGEVIENTIESREYYFERISLLEINGDGISYNLPSFYIGSQEFYFEQSMTWEQWVESEYNTAGFYIKDGFVGTAEAGLTSAIYQKDYGFVEVSSSIEKTGYEYKLLMVNVLPDIQTINIQTFSILGQTFNFEVGMTWAEWTYSDYNTEGYLVTEDGYIVDAIGTNYVSIQSISNFKVSATDEILNYEYDQIGVNEFYIYINNYKYYEVVQEGTAWREFAYSNSGFAVKTLISSDGTIEGTYIIDNTRTEDYILWEGNGTIGRTISPDKVITAGEYTFVKNS